MEILIADDNNTDRLILKRILEKDEHTVYTAVDGLEAVRQYKLYNPDIILMDALMPNMDGFEAAIEIKALAKDHLIPIIFLTSLQEASALARCLEVGGDDFLTKPYNRIILQAKIAAFKRMKNLYDQVRKQRNEIQYYSDRLIQEQEVAKRVFDNIAHRGNLEKPNVKFLLSPMSVFNGDLLLCASKPSGGDHVMLGDFTGHGLPAAIGAMPVAEIFYGMTLKGFSIEDITAEVNQRLKEILPVGVFCCATLCDINYRDNALTVWSGGLPDAYLLRPKKGLVNSISSSNLPLGVLDSESFSNKTNVYRFNEGDRLYIFSDGIMEAENPEGEMYGEDRLLNLVSGAVETGSFYEKLIEELKEFSQSDEQSDDLTLIEYTFDDSQTDVELENNQQTKDTVWPLDWSFEYELRPQTLRSFDPLPLVLQILMECPGLRPYRGRVFTILAELYSNALDHGVLRLDSKLKSSTTGFTEYYELRQQRLDELSEGYVRINMEHLPTDDGGQLIIQVEDTGQGFDVKNLRKADNSFSGRGLQLVNSLCTSVEHFNEGRTVKVVYQWHYA